MYIERTEIKVPATLKPEQNISTLQRIRAGEIKGRTPHDARTYRATRMRLAYEAKMKALRDAQKYDATHAPSSIWPGAMMRWFAQWHNINL